MDFTPCKSLHNEDLEMTRNPFDSKDFDKENCPAFSPSIFVKSSSQGSSEKKNKDFRWSIDQIAVLKPADIEEYPYQEYSVSYVREEDEIAAQNAVNEYFAKAMLPSPWTRNNKDHAFKRVTFSPHPPTYFKETPETSKSSINSSGRSDDGKKFVDGSCQTTLTIPPNVDFEKLLGNTYFTYQEETMPSMNKELNVSSLRRKLFSQEEASSPKEDANAHDDDNLCVEIKGLVSGNSTPKTPKTPRTPNWITSSPFRDTTPSNRLSSNSHDSVFQSSFIAEPFLSPTVSPIKDSKETNDNEANTLELTDDSLSISISSVEDSNRKANDPSQLKTSVPSAQYRTNIPSIEPFDSLTDVKESTRNSPIEIPGVSPIRHDREEAMDISVVSSTRLYGAVNISELPDISQSVKESTARHLHGMTGLFSPISGSRKVREYKNTTDLGKSVIMERNDDDDPDVSFDDGGPLDITDLSSPEQQEDKPCDRDEESYQSDDVFQNPVVIVSPFPTPKRGILKHRPAKEDRKAAKTEAYLNDRFRSLEHKLCEVENRLESVESAREKEKKQSGGKDGMPACSVSSSNGVTLSKEMQHQKYEDRKFGEEATTRVPFKDVANQQEMHENRYHHQTEKRNFDIDNVVIRADAALSKAKKIQSSIDGDFEFFLENTTNGGTRPTDDDRESSEVAGIMERRDANLHEYNSDLFQYDVASRIKNEVLALQGDKFNEYRIAGIRDSFNDSVDVRSRTTLDTGEFDNSILPAARRDSRVPTPVMNLAGLSIYTAAKENKIPYALPKPLERERRGLTELSKTERRHTWPSLKSQRCSTNYYGRSISPCFPSRYRGSKTYCLIKQDTANKIRDDWKIRPSSRNDFLASFR